MTQKDIIIKLFTYLEKKNLLNHKSVSLFSNEFQMMHEKVNKSSKTFYKLLGILNNQSKWKQFIENNKKLGLDECDTRRIFSQYLIQYSLDYVELMKRCLIESLIQGAKINGKTINFTITLGTLINSIVKQFNCNDILSLFPYEFRNVLGHGTWWWNKQDFCYNDDSGKLISLNFKQYMDKMKIFEDSFRMIIEERAKRKKI